MPTTPELPRELTDRLSGTLTLTPQTLAPYLENHMTQFADQYRFSGKSVDAIGTLAYLAAHCMGDMMMHEFSLAHRTWITG